MPHKKENRMKNITKRLFVVINIAVIIMMMASGYAGLINPADHPYLSLLGFAFPAFLLCNIFFIVLWVFISPARLIIPFFGFIAAYTPTQYYCPLNIQVDVPEGALKVMSYNALGFDNREVEVKGAHPILEYMEDSGADIICLQEYNRVCYQDSMWHIVDSIYPYHAEIRSKGYAEKGGSKLAVYSRFPIIRNENIDIYTRGNTVGVFTLDIHGEKVYVINAHLESIGFSQEEKMQFSEMVHGNKEKGEIKREAKTLIAKLAESARIRGPQADAIARFISGHKGEKIIFCGDINDHPLSYVHHTIASKMRDCYRMAGKMPGFSFRHHNMYVRIDNIFCSDHWKPYGCMVDRSIEYSDHYPIYCFLSEENSSE